MNIHTLHNLTRVHVSQAETKETLNIFICDMTYINLVAEIFDNEHQ